VRDGSYFPSLLEPRKRAERALGDVGWVGSWRGCVSGLASESQRFLAGA